MLWLKGCDHCGGDLYEDEVWDGLLSDVVTEVRCLLCGREAELRERVSSR